MFLDPFFIRPLSMLEESNPLKIGDTFIEMPFSVNTPMVICCMTGRLERIKVPFIGPTEGSELALSHSYQATWKEWIEYRRGMKAVKDWSKLFQKQVEWLAKYTPDVAVEILNTSMRNGWTGVFDPSKSFSSKPAPMVNHI